ncbi:hypothetical protein LuPra_02752 [Luteitalea pratensis]|uniref:Response regulatory domain-containing protein n=1 Tax=Luteitalea pratensis TaxID=1855912 RepID=A0A143PMU7_LUTPR|nr:hypothetical protein [Luteitalea pratensis]AMY09533.1 hypothetical protein LuPra_02752 [Luteitalea pratensis]
MTPLALVLLIDDYADTRDLYGTYLRMHGYRIEEAETHSTASRQCATW